MLGQLIKETIKEDFPFPHGPIVYVVTEKKWDSQPAISSKPLYVGMSGVTNVHQSRARLGALISNMLGFFKIKDNKRHRGGERIFEYCKNIRIARINYMLLGVIRPIQTMRNVRRYPPLDQSSTKNKNHLFFSYVCFQI
jgi:hypothetical protein